MPKPRTPSRRKARKSMSFNQTVPKKRSKKKADQLRKGAYSQEALESSTSGKPPDNRSGAEGDPEQVVTTREDLWSLSTAMASQFAGRTLENYARAFSVPLPLQTGQPVGRQAMPRGQLPSLTRNGVQAIGRELMSHFIEQGHRQFQAANALARSRSPQDFLKVQIDLAKGNFDSFLEAAGRIFVIGVQMGTEAVRLSQPDTQNRPL